MYEKNSKISTWSSPRVVRISGISFSKVCSWWRSGIYIITCALFIFRVVLAEVIFYEKKPVVWWFWWAVSRFSLWRKMPKYNGVVRGGRRGKFSDFSDGSDGLDDNEIESFLGKYTSFPRIYKLHVFYIQFSLKSSQQY